ncbi:dihydroxyacetone kinase subunit DhaL [Candidatus Rhodobacter oscarellae]|nr:dihydroxyacetone kinase subunit DhaL [Candidatus Rhodobacter lobularis]
MLLAVADAMDENRDMLCVLDGEIGDADHGIAMSGGFAGVREALDELEGTPTEVLNTAAKAFLNAVGASSGPLYATAFMRAGMAVKGKDKLGPADAAAMVAAMAEGIAHRGKAQQGDKTMLDAWAPAGAAAMEAEGSIAAILTAAAEAAEAGAQATADMEAKLGRAARLGARSLGHKDPGAASAAIMLRAMAAAV